MESWSFLLCQVLTLSSLHYGKGIEAQRREGEVEGMRWAKKTISPHFGDRGKPHATVALSPYTTPSKRAANVHGGSGFHRVLNP